VKPLSKDFLLQRGFCCRNGCANCPYGYRRERMLDKCVLCNKDSVYDKEEHIDFRIGYVEGCGQLCLDCCADVSWKNVEQMIDDEPNDMKLGGKLRELKNRIRGLI
tara:strand:+ start:1437 stop:1754 length:318 start_codon:yes stop_codon:yes gene_type:complete